MRAVERYESTSEAYLTQMGRGRNRAGFWAKVGLKICCDLGEEMECSRQEEHPVFTNKEAGLVYIHGKD